MKKYQEQLEIIEKLQAKSAELEVHTENAYNDMMKNWEVRSDRNTYKAYWDKLMEQSLEISKRINKHIETLTLYDGDDKICWIGEDGMYMQHKYLNVREMDKLMSFLQLMNEEVK